LEVNPRKGGEKAGRVREQGHGCGEYQGEAQLQQRRTAQRVSLQFVERAANFGGTQRHRAAARRARPRQVGLPSLPNDTRSSSWISADFA
jgi:hypothetical protein